MLRLVRTLRWIHRGQAVLGLGVIAVSIVMLVASRGEVVSTAIALLPGLFGAHLLLNWWKERLDGTSLQYDADETDMRLRSLEMVDDDRPCPPTADPDTLVRMLETRRFLPAARPRGWSPPITPTDGGCYHITAGREKLLVSMTREGKEPTSLLRVLIFPPSHSMEPVSEQRCHEILAHFQKVQEWMEVAIHSEPRAATARNFLAIPEGATLSSRPVTKAQLLN